MDTTRDKNHDQPAIVRPSYEEVFEEYRRLKSRIEELTKLVEQLRCESKRQAAPFRKNA
jgi:hypothetical protein